MFEMCETLKTDLLLFKELGLTPFRAKLGERTLVGKVQLGSGSYVKIWVSAAPAQFWYFEVYCAESEKVYKVSTGSGSLTSYWESVRKIAEGLFIIDEISERYN
jgi:hypothetical protein